MNKILIADDNERQRSSLVGLLCKEYEIDQASNAEEEISKARDSRYTAIITDNEMEDGHGSSGIYAIQEIRKFDKNVPIYLISGNMNPELEKIAYEYGATGAFDKMMMFEMRQILRKL